MMKADKTKLLGQVFTPPFVVNLMVDLRQNKALCGKKILDAGCGEGAFLIEVVRRYIQEFLEYSNDLNSLKKELEENIIGIEIDKEALEKCRRNLNAVALDFGLQNIMWNLRLGDFLEIFKPLRGQIDLVIGKPPYIRIHHLNNKSRQFTKGGMSDLFLIFFDLGLECLKKGGELIFITPSSWLKSKAGTYLREKIFTTKNLFQLIDFSHEKVFEKITTYSLISAFQKGVAFEEVNICEFKNNALSTPKKIPYENLFLQNKEIFFGENNFKEILDLKPLNVKNGFATLCDAFFMGDFAEYDYPTIRVLKASNGKWLDCIYPYDEDGRFVKPSGSVLKRYFNFEKRLKNRDLRGKNWQEFGRTQAINDTFKRKIAFNTLIRDIKDLKIAEVKAGEGVFSGLYIVSDLPLTVFEKALKNDKFLDFIKSLKKYKNGGYYTFSSSDLGKFLAHKLNPQPTEFFLR